MRNKKELLKSAGSGFSDRVIIEILADIRDTLIKQFAKGVENE